MKKTISFSIITALFFLQACNPAATFDQPQPADVKPSTAFPKQLQGQYLDSSQASIVTITEKLITRHYDFDFKQHKDSLNNYYKLVGDTLINLSDSSKQKVTVNGDTIIQHIEGTDTLFNISADNVLKKFKGYYFLNMLVDTNSWEVKKLSLDNSVLIIAAVSQSEDLQKLKEITETASDTSSTHFTLTRRQFKKFVKQDGFAEQEKFIRLNKNQ